MARFLAILCIGLCASSVSYPRAAIAQGILSEWASVPVPPPPSVGRVTIDPKTTALLVLDIAKTTCNSDVRPRCIAMLPKVKVLMAKIRAKGLPVIYALGAQPKHGVPGDIWPEAAMVGEEPWVRSGPDKFLNTDLEKTLKDKGITTVVVIGRASHGAVLHTSDAAVFRGLNVIVVVDAIAAESVYAEQYAVWHLQNAPRMAAKVKLTAVDLIE